MFPVIDILGWSLPTYLILNSLIFTFTILVFLQKVVEQGRSLFIAKIFSLYLLVGCFLGSRLFYELWVQKTSVLELYKVLIFWKGGFVFYGGLFGTFGAALLFKLRYPEQKVLSWADLAAPILPFSYAFGRFTCFLAGCCYGRSCELPWAVKSSFDGVMRHPTQLYAFVLELLLGCLILFFYKNRMRIGFLKHRGSLFFSWILGHSILRYIMEIYRDDPRGEFVLGLSISQCLSLVLFIAAGIFLFRPRATK